MSDRHSHRPCQSVDMEPMDDMSGSSNQTWLQDGINSMQLKRSEMNELIMDYLVHEGFKEAAERFREEAGINPGNIRLYETDNNSSDNVNQKPTESTSSPGNSNNSSVKTSGVSGNVTIKNETQHNLPTPSVKPADNYTGDERIGLGDWPNKMETPEMMDKRIEVRHSVEEGDILRAQSLINLYYPELLDNHRDLYFKLQQQHLIELIRQQKINDVLAYVHDQLSVDELRDLTEMERTLALLAYENPDKSPYAGLLHTSHRLQLASDINDMILQETTGDVEATKPRLVTLLKLLFWTQSELERKKIQFPKMTDLVNGTIVEPRHS